MGDVSKVDKFDEYIDRYFFYNIERLYIMVFSDRYKEAEEEAEAYLYK